MNCPRILIAGTHSGAGKTTVATGIMAALRNRGLCVQGFKVGPDFIDPGFHHAATGRPSHNLDGWMLSRETNLEIFERATSCADVAVIEGVMGVFDGKCFSSLARTAALAGTTAEMSFWLETTNVLVVDASAMAGSAAAVVHGFDTLMPEFTVSAVVCNKVGSEKHRTSLNDALAAHCRPERLGFLPQDSNISVPERHLGLHLGKEWRTQERLKRLADWIEEHLDVDGLLRLAEGPRPDLPIKEVPRSRVKARIGAAKDSAFCFYYQDNLDTLGELGAELIEFSPVADATLPPGLDGIYLGGGYPEVHAEELSANESMRRAIADFAANDGPIYAECGGFMYLTDAIVDMNGKRWPMTGIFPTTARMQPRLAKLGYVEAEDIRASGWGKARGHEFRYSKIDLMPEHIRRAYREPAEGYQIRSVLGSYVHLHFGSCPQFAEEFVRRCESYKYSQ